MRIDATRNDYFNPAEPTILHIDLNSCFATVEQQELTLSKLAHTIGFALVFGILASLAPMTFVAGTWEQRLIAIGLVVLCVGAWAIANVLDMTLRSMTYLLVEAHPHPSRYRQKPWPWRQPVTAT